VGEWALLWQCCKISLAPAELHIRRKIYMDMLKLFGFPQVAEMIARYFSNRMTPHIVSLFRFELL
jgi:hypothetical protein